ncbi:branched-chain amino acid transport system permease protein [Bradyrhizobium sp. LB9.1b]
MYELMEFVVRGAFLGVIYGLLAFPISLVFATTGSVDLAVGAYTVLAVAIAWAVGGPAGVVLGIAAAVLSSAVVGFISMRLNRPGTFDHITAVLGTFGLATFLESFILTFYGKDPMARQMFDTFWDALGVRVSPQALINIVVCLLLLLALYVLLYRTPFGRMMRASAVNPLGAALNGIPVQTIWFSTYLLGGFLAGVAGILVLYTTGADYSTGLSLTISGFGAAIIFGMNSPLRGFAGGLVTGLVQALSSAYLPGGWVTAAPMIFIFVVLALGPMNRIAATGGRV